MNSKLLVSILFFCGAAFAQQDADIQFKSTEVVPGLYMIEGVGGFAGGKRSA